MKNKKLEVGKELVKRTKHLNETLEGGMTPVNVKKELESLDRNNFKDVYELVDKIVNDIMVTSKEFSTGQPDQDKLANDLVKDMMKDYMIDLINPELLDFN